MISVISMCVFVLGLAALWRKNKILAWSLIAAGNVLTLADSVRQDDGLGVVLSAAALLCCAGWLAALILARRKVA